MYNREDIDGFALSQAILDALPGLRRFALSLAGNRQDADDLLQSTVERTLGRARPADLDVSRWMFRVCRNLWIDELRSRRVRTAAPYEPELLEDTAAAVDDLTLRDVNTALATLSEEQRSVLVLVAVEGLSYQEAADALQIPVGTVMSRLARARTALAARFGDAR